MDLAKQAQIVDSIHDTLHDFVGQRLKVRANMGRSKIVESEGTLMQVHPQLFIMEVDRKRGRTARQSYQYVDVLTGMVELSQNGEPLFERLNEENTFSRKAQYPWGCSSAGRALRSQRRGRGFESHHLHHGNAKAVGPTGGLFLSQKRVGSDTLGT